MAYYAVVKDVEPEEVAAIDAHAEMPEIAATMGAAYGELYGTIAAQRLDIVGPPTALYADVDEDRGVTVKICVPIVGSLAPTGRVHPDRLPGGTVVTVLHRGPYEELHKAYEAVQMYATENHLTLAGPMRERYLNGPPETPPEDFQTQILWPVADAA